MGVREDLGFEIVDSHQHFIDVSRYEYYWMKGVPSTLHHSFGPEQIEAVLKKAGVGFCVAVQAHPSTEESLHLVELAARFPFIRGIVASVDLTDPRLAATLNEYRKIPVIRGVRHQQAEDQDARWFLRPDVMRGLGEVEKSGLCYDFLCRSHQLSTASDVARSLPGLKIVLEHAGKPPIKAREFDEWVAAIDLLAPATNVCCKLSELITQADWSAWRAEDVAPYVSHVVKTLGYERVMWGSGWPICLLASSYAQTISTIVASLPGASRQDLKKVFHDNALRWYGLDAA